MSCNQCGGQFTVGPSEFPGFDLLACSGCGRPVRLIVLGSPRARSAGVSGRDEKRALRAARRRKLAQGGGDV